MTLAPARRAIWTAALPTPLPAAVTSTVSPAHRAARSMSMCHAVENATWVAAASSKPSPTGSGSRLPTGARRCAA